ncbi:AraC family transcriptional regulator [Cohnella endophytica]|uniref:AraC family transcriptional regulator n=1 Tax=Cohnella endophytica TaxID=2419778 RepID=UPI0013145EB2|nr:AraC family transcriptional regulator [Cohnella endophytica]
MFNFSRVMRRGDIGLRYLKTEIRQPFEFLSAGQFNALQPWTHARREIDSFEIIIGAKGTLHIQQQEERYAVEPGSVLLLLPGETHFGYQPSSGGLMFYWLHFLCPGIPRICGEDDWEKVKRLSHTNEYLSAKNDSVYLPVFFRCGNLDRIEILFNQLQHLANSKLRHRYALHYLATSLFLELAEQAESGDEERSTLMPDPLVADIVEWIRVHAAEPLTVSSIADQYGYNRDYLSRLFKKTMGMNLQEYILVQKLSKAKSLLSGSNRTVKQIALEVGIPDEKYFIRLFRKYEHLTPTGYRNAYYRKHMNIN